MKITYKQIQAISQELIGGMDVYVNRQTLETRCMIDFDLYTDDHELWEEDLKNIKQEWKEYFIIRKMQSKEAFEVMEAFLDEVDDLPLKKLLTRHLNGKRPFAHFKTELNMTSFRQKWFDFQQSKYEDYVKRHLQYEHVEFA